MRLMELALLTALVPAAGGGAEPGAAGRSLAPQDGRVILVGSRRDRTLPPRDCTPINGRYGYYGNPWCDTGSYRLEDQQFRWRANDIRRRAVPKGY